MSCPDRQKAKFGLYREFLSKLSFKACRVETERWKVPIASRRFGAKFFLESLIHKMPPKVRRKLKGTRRYQGSGEYINCLREQLNNHKLFERYFSPSKLQRYAEACTGMQMQTLFTVVSYIEEVESGKSTIENYVRRSFS